MRFQRICHRCRRTFECIAQQSRGGLCGACLIALGLIAPHDLPHNHNDPVIDWVRSRVVTVASTTSVSTTVSASSVSWSVPKRDDNTS